MSITPISPADAARRLAEGDLVLVDVREDDEWQAGHAPGALHQPLGQLTAESVPPGVALAVTCKAGPRAAKAAQTLDAAGREVLDLSGGMQAWLDAGLPVRRPDGSPGTIS